MPENPAYVRACSLTYTQEARIREIIREEIAAHFASVSRSEAGARPLRVYRDRDEPPAAPVPDSLP